MKANKARLSNNVLQLLAISFLYFNTTGIMICNHIYFILGSSANQCVKQRRLDASTRCPEFTSARNERVKILINPCIRKMDRIGMRSRKSCAARPQEGGRHAVSKFRRPIRMKIAVEKR